MKTLLIHEVGPRDGLQVEKVVVPTDQKERWVLALLAAGVDLVQAGSFVHPEKVPPMADSDEVFRRLIGGGVPAERLSGLVLNEKGLDRALACGVGLVCMGVSASETHSRKNTGMGTDEATGRILATAKKAVAAGSAVQVSVQSAFGCGFEGTVPAERVLGIVRSYLDAGMKRICLADTAGHAWPEQVERLYGEVRRLAPDAELACHFHDTYGTGMANVYAALRSGVTSFDSSFAGLGGCPFTKVAAGNVATEDLVHAFQREGRRPDIDLGALIEIARSVGAFFGREMPGRVQKTGAITADVPAASTSAEGVR